MRYLITFIVLILCFYPASLLAGVTVSGCCSSTGQIATPQEVSKEATAAADKVSQEVLKIGQAISGEQKKLMTSINTNFKAQNKQLSELFESFGLAKQKMDAFKEFGEGSTSYLNCDEYTIGEQIREGKKAEKKFSDTVRKDLSSHANDHTSSRVAYKRLEEMIDQDITAEDLFPTDGTLSPEQVDKAVEMSKTILDPLPTPAVPEHLQDTTPGKDYRAVSMIKRSKMAVPETVMADTVAAHSPTIELGEWAEEMMIKAGGESEATKGDMISPMGLIDLFVDMRFANPDWYQGQDGIHSKTKTGLLREMLTMQSVQMEMERRQTRSLQQIALMMAEQTASSTTEDFDDALNHLREKALNANIKE